MTENIGLFKKGHKCSNTGRTQFKKGMIPWSKGKVGLGKGHIVSEETKKKIGLKLMGNKNSLGIKHSTVRNKKISEARKKRIGIMYRGENANNWKGGLTPKNNLIRNSLEFKVWGKKVFEQDNYTCQSCGLKKNLNAHHIFAFYKYPEYRFETWNGQTLCVLCHEHLHNELGRR